MPDAFHGFIPGIAVRNSTMRLSCRASRASRASRCCALIALLVVPGMLPAHAGETEGDESRDVLVVFEPNHRAALSARVSSEVVTIHKELGQSFKKGDPLVSLDDTVYRANARKARALYERATTQLEAKEKLYNDNTLSLTELQQARAEAAATQADLEIAEKDLASCTIRAPFDGRVSEVMVREHEMVRAGQEQIEVVNDDLLRASFLVPSKTLTTLKIGQTVRMRVEETGAVVAGTISHIGSLIDPVSSTVKVLAEVKNSDGKLRGGMRGALSLETISLSGNKNAE